MISMAGATLGRIPRASEPGRGPKNVKLLPFHNEQVASEDTYTYRDMIESVLIAFDRTNMSPQQ